MKNFLIRYSKWQYLPLVFILALAGYFYLHNLGTDYITLWDEAVHVNVVKNLADKPWPPKLHLTDIGIDFQDWTNNYIWVHKPLLPLYLQAVFYKIFGQSLFAFRLPSALFALISVIVLFWVARRHFGYIAALAASSLFALNSYVFELIKGRQFSGLHDLMFVFFGILALDRVLRIAYKPSSTLESRPLPDPPQSPGKELKWNYILFGLFVGLGYLSKGGLALLFFPALFIVSILLEDKKQAFLNFLYATLTAFIVVLPEKISLLLLYPAEYYFEQSVQVLHLFKDLEYWGRPWDYYLTVYLRELLLPYLYLPVLAGMVYGFYRTRQDRRLLVLVVWLLTFFVPLSFGVTKISNFIFAVLPAILLLTVLLFEWLWREKKFGLIFAISATVILSYAIIRLDLWQVKFHLFQDYAAIQRFAILVYEILAFVAILAVYKFIERYVKTPILPKTVLLLAFFLILGTYARANQLSDLKLRDDYKFQRKIRQVAFEVKGKYPQDSIFLLYYPRLLKAHLYFQYWSGLDAMEIYDRQPIFVLKKILPKNRPVFVLAYEKVVKNDLNLISQGDFGFLYRVNYDN